jgi:hypothetical protein
MLFREDIHKYALKLSNGTWVTNTGSASTLWSRYFDVFDGAAVVENMVNKSTWPKHTYTKQYAQHLAECIVAQLTETKPAMMAVAFEVIEKLPIGGRDTIPCLLVLQVLIRKWPVNANKVIDVTEKQVVRTLKYLDCTPLPWM